jgi:maltodextrin utilization protein YvdJ
MSRLWHRVGRNVQPDQREQGLDDSRAPVLALQLLRQGMVVSQLGFILQLCICFFLVQTERSILLAFALATTPSLVAWQARRDET